jgi:hypothetical protein
MNAGGKSAAPEQSPEQRYFRQRVKGIREPLATAFADARERGEGVDAEVVELTLRRLEALRLDLEMGVVL